MKIQLSRILLLNAAGFVLFLCWYLPVNHGLWFTLDSAIFHFFNRPLAHHRAWVWFLAITNNRAFDGCSLLAMGTLMLRFWLRGAPSERRRIVIIGLVMLLTAIIVNQLAQALMPVKRASPTLFFHDALRVSDFLPLSTKDASKDSFPGDHGMMLLIFCSFMWRYFGQKTCQLALLIFVIFAFPRVMIGAHWLTDIVIGSFSSVLIALPWILLTPVSDKMICFMDHYLPGKNKQKINK
ncbi:hypothetical protein CHU32_01480 [Superficieibacter electus]|uniref:Lipid A 1-diphosphate synthase n=1 Tax=Superficieibacter electus TaxID=2022662 RepID=A0A2P5GWE7_9ENTR|nr:phosphatase PAP2 family protein [Superficieibacter electus]POP47838.1 hypothetical protein CHU33_01475 [Superficieibacter electus]POP50851.1 hypothetical protein CHU32_01480 [Superficieibacter electus]